MVLFSANFYRTATAREIQGIGFSQNVENLLKAVILKACVKFVVGIQGAIRNKSHSVIFLKTLKYRGQRSVYKLQFAGKPGILSSGIICKLSGQTSLGRIDEAAASCKNRGLVPV